MRDRRGLRTKRRRRPNPDRWPVKVIQFLVNYLLRIYEYFTTYLRKIRAPEKFLQRNDVTFWQARRLRYLHLYIESKMSRSFNSHKRQNID